MFSDELEKISWEETTKAIYSKTDADVRRALGKSGHLDVNDFMALISPAATPYLEVMARLSQIPGTDGTTEQKIHRRTFRQNHLHVYTSIYNKLLHQLLCVLRFPYQ